MIALRISFLFVLWVLCLSSAFAFLTVQRPTVVSRICRESLAATNAENNGTSNTVAMDDVGFVLLAGGTGSRMKATMPKQFLELRGVPVLHHSLDLFLERLPEHLKAQNKAPPAYVVLVMDPIYQEEYQAIVNRYDGRLVFANPGVERQGSVENGLNKLVEVSDGNCKYVAIHDSARPLVTIPELCKVVHDAKEHGAAVLGVPCKATIKETEDGSTVLRTLPRARLWEVHTPQVIKIETLQRGFVKVARENLEVTDDVSIVEALGEPVKLTLGEYTNLKITTPEDMDVAEAILEERKDSPVSLIVA
jgi:2-C-methyl-D-erythritol 4-phosphate cytidylyltransferase